MTYFGKKKKRKKINKAGPKVVNKLILFVGDLMPTSRCRSEFDPDQRDKCVIPEDFSLGSRMNFSRVELEIESFNIYSAIHFRIRKVKNFVFFF